MAVSDTRDEQTGRRPVEGVRVKLTPGWDASLTYDMLNHEARDAEQVFVGRQEHLGPLVNAVGQRDRRGTYLVSGYRGVGKTSLIIQSVRLARRRLEAEGSTLLPVVLNVSEVSASLEPASEVEASPLQIDARRLLTALLRALRNQVAPRPSPDPLARKIRWAYEKAEATTYVQTQQQRGEAVRTATSAARAGVRVPDVLKLVAAVSLLAAAAVEGVALLGSVVSYLHVAAVALAAVAVVSFSGSVSLTKSTTDRESRTEELVRDNSLHQLESELKDILQDLYEEEHRRTVIVLEELDKISDEEGQQLDSVIRYFKNLFTQAPALFFFLTDKGYYDVISEKIQRARRRRSYAVEHTFFTHRLFVRRPGIEECLEYLKAIMVSEERRSEIEAIAQAQGSRVRATESMSALEQVVRVLLFRSQDHFFDLKNELRQYVRVTEDGSWLECDEVSMPRGDRALAAFQFLVEQKVRNNYFGGARDYANEALKSCLFAVFEGLGSTEDQEVARFYPSEDPEGGQLSLSERRRIVEAVDSLVEELERGGAIQMVPFPPDAGTRFVWKSDAAQRFQPVARLEDWEETLQQDLSRMVGVAELFAPGGRLAGVAGGPAEADAVVERLRRRVQELQRSPAALPREEADADRREAEKELSPLLRRAYRAHQERLTEAYGVGLTPVTGSISSPAFFLSTSDPSQRPVVLRYQPVGQEGDPGVELLPYSDQLQRLAVVDVTFDAALADARPPAGGKLGKRALATAVPLHEGIEHATPEMNWGERTADELRFAQLWCRFDPAEAAGGEAVRGPGGPYVLVTGDQAQEPVSLPSLPQAVAAWLQSDDRYLAWSPDLGPSLAAVERVLMFEPGPDASPVVVANPVVPMAAPQSPDAKDAAPGFGLRHGPTTVDLDDQEHAAVDRLIRAGRIVHFVSLGPDEAEAEERPPDGEGPEPPRTLVETAAAPAWAGGVSVLHPTPPRPLAPLVRLVRGPHPGYAIGLLRPGADAGDVEAIRKIIALLDDPELEEHKAWERRLRELTAEPEPS